MKKNLIFTLILLISGISFNAAAQQAASQKSEAEQIAELIASMPVQPGMEAPDFTLKNLEGEDVSLSSFRGKWVVLDFWGSWCRFCVKAFPGLKEAYSEYHNDGLEIIGLDCLETEELWKQAVDKFELPWVNLYCPGERGTGVMGLYGVKAFPTQIVIDPDGKVCRIFLGESPEFESLLRSIFRR